MAYEQTGPCVLCPPLESLSLAVDFGLNRLGSTRPAGRGCYHIDGLPLQWLRTTLNISLAPLVNADCRSADYPAATALRRKAPGDNPKNRLKARMNAASEAYPSWLATSDTAMFSVCNHAALKRMRHCRR